MIVKIQNFAVAFRCQKKTKILRKNNFKEFCKVIGKKSQFFVMLMNNKDASK